MQVTAIKLKLGESNLYSKTSNLKNRSFSRVNLKKSKCVGGHNFGLYFMLK
jgi:hypothetical protein